MLIYIKICCTSKYCTSNFEPFIGSNNCFQYSSILPLDHDFNKLECILLYNASTQVILFWSIDFWENYFKTIFYGYSDVKKKWPQLWILRYPWGSWFRQTRITLTENASIHILLGIKKKIKDFSLFIQMENSTPIKTFLYHGDHDLNQKCIHLT